MLQQYQQQPDYTTPYGGVSGIGYSAQPDAGYFNYAAAAAESSWYGSPSPAADVVHSGLSHNAACNTTNTTADTTTHVVGDGAGNFLNHGGYSSNNQTTTTTGPASSSTAESTFVVADNHAASDMQDPMAHFLNGHQQNMNGNDDKIKEESIDWLSTIIDEEVAAVDHGNRQDVGGTRDGGAVGKLLAGADLPARESREPNGRLPNFHQAFGSTEIGRFSQHEYYEPPKDGECMQTAVAAGQAGPGAVQAAGTAARRAERSSAAAFEPPPRQQNRRGRTPRGGGGQHRRAKQQATTRTAAGAVHQYAQNYDVVMTGSAAVGGGGGGGAAVGSSRHQMLPPYHHHHHHHHHQDDPYGRNHHTQLQRYHHHHQHHQQQQQQEYHHPSSSSYATNHHHEQYYRPYDRMHYQQQQQQQQQQQLQQPPMNQFNYGSNRGEQQSTYATPGGYNRFHSCCSTEHIARPSHHSYGPGQYYGDYNAYGQQW